MTARRRDGDDDEKKGARPMSTTPLASFAERLVELSQSSLPEAVVHETRRTFMNVLGTAIGASRSSELDALLRTGVALGGTELAVLGRHERVDRYYAALALGFAAHFDDFDDTHLVTVIHPGAATMAAIYPIALCEESPADQVLMAMALGVEAQLRVGLAMTPSHYDLGWHITGTCGVIGAAVAAGVLFELDADQLGAAMAIAAGMTVGQREAFGTPIKPFHAGKAAANGLLAASLARAGLIADTGLLTDDGGYFSVLSKEWSTQWLDPADLGDRWTVLDNTYKPFPCGIVAHPAIEAATLLHPVLHGRTDEEIVEVRVACNPLVVELMGRSSASTGLEARFCAIHGVTVGLLCGRGGLHEFSDEMSVDPRVVAVRDRTRLYPDESIGRQGATVTVVFADGAQISETVVAASGSMERPLTDEQLTDKFESLVAPILGNRAGLLASYAMELGDRTIAEIDAVVVGR